MRAAPEKGAANAALVALLAKALGLPKSKLRVTRGAAARLKAVEIDAEIDIAAFLTGLPEAP